MAFKDWLKKEMGRVADTGKRTWAQNKLIHHYLMMHPLQAMADMQIRIPAMAEQDYRTFIRLLDAGMGMAQVSAQSLMASGQQSGSWGITTEDRIAQGMAMIQSGPSGPNPGAMMAQGQAMRLFWIKQQAVRIRKEAAALHGLMSPQGP
ncbi:hypothetical protein HPC49_29250 [Pyxidicoccus fallax]|uniref:Uncharacterized protein n=1 Tax=Pyxidicoccus fallax TaxID=394095 RepID=A0A848LUD9_9BACT|nr:hypothetical protein [Pyxidicoccus fallax]NMO21212.1 hypothetical protein [Pyxidicoccus fallax]NPC82293.1 hypothetical protein [Pyxidicoccus fallax]